MRAAIHVIGRDRLPQWTVCTDAIVYTSNIPALYPEPYLTLIKNYRVLVFNGGTLISYASQHSPADPQSSTAASSASTGFPVQMSKHIALSFVYWHVAFDLLGFLPCYLALSCVDLSPNVLVGLFIFLVSLRAPALSRSRRVRADQRQ